MFNVKSMHSAGQLVIKRLKTRCLENLGYFLVRGELEFDCRVHGNQIPSFID